MYTSHNGFSLYAVCLYLAEGDETLRFREPPRSGPKYVSRWILLNISICFLTSKMLSSCFWAILSRMH